MTSRWAQHMRAAIDLAEKGRWTAAPNPTVGAVLVRDGVQVAAGWHVAPGTPHAEVMCLADARKNNVNPAECTLVVTLEPCNHFGKTPPCSQAIIEAGIRHVVMGLRDPNPVAAGGAQALREHGVTVDEGILEQECRDLVDDFLCWQITQNSRTSLRPYVILKLAGTLDGRIATRSGHSQWITSEAARYAVHQTRAGVGLAGGAILVGGNTLRADNPLLTARNVETPQQPLAVAITSHLPTPDCALLQTRATETLFFTTQAESRSTRSETVQNCGARVVALDNWNTPKALHNALEFLRGEMQCRYVLCEGGGKLGLSLLNASLVDQFQLYTAPKILGDNEAAPLFAGRTPQCMSETLNLRITETRMFGPDCRLTLRPEV